MVDTPPTTPTQQGAFNQGMAQAIMLDKWYGYMNEAAAMSNHRFRIQGCGVVFRTISPKLTPEELRQAIEWQNKVTQAYNDTLVIERVDPQQQMLVKRTRVYGMLVHAIDQYELFLRKATDVHGMGMPNRDDAGMAFEEGLG